MRSMRKVRPSRRQDAQAIGLQLPPERNVRAREGGLTAFLDYIAGFDECVVGPRPRLESPSIGTATHPRPCTASTPAPSRVDEAAFGRRFRAAFSSIPPGGSATRRPLRF